MLRLPLHALCGLTVHYMADENHCWEFWHRYKMGNMDYICDQEQIQTQLLSVQTLGSSVIIHGNLMRIWRRAEIWINGKPACRKVWFQWDHGHFPVNVHYLSSAGFLLRVVEVGYNTVMGQLITTKKVCCVFRVVINSIFTVGHKHDSSIWDLKWVH